MKTVIGALLVSVALCSQGFGFDLLDRMKGMKCGGDCGGCNACEKVAPCEAAKACAPDPACGACEPACGKKCGKPCCTPIRDLFAGMKGLFECKKCSKPNCGCEPSACTEAKACAPDPAVCEKACEKACEPACDPCAPACGPKKCKKLFGKCKKSCEKACEVPACEKACEQPACDPCAPACGPKKCKKQCRPLLDLMDDIFGCKKSCKKSCNSCGPKACEAAAACDTGCGGCGGGAPAQNGDVKEEKKEETTLLPKAPTPDPRASLLRSRGIYQASRSVVVRN
jgi:hypothetical protein